MNDAPKKKRLKIDTSNYRSGGKGVSTFELMTDPTANDALWATPDDDLLECSEKETPHQPETNGDCQKVSTSISPKMLINLTNKKINKHKDAYAKTAKITQMLFKEVLNIQLFKDISLFEHYKDNKSVIKGEIRKAVKRACEKIIADELELRKTVIEYDLRIEKQFSEVIQEKLANSMLKDEEKTEIIKSCMGTIKAKMY